MPINPISSLNLDGKLLSNPSSPNQRGARGDDEKLKKACMDLEALFIHQILKSMRQTLPKSGLIGGGSGEEIFQSLFDQELSRSLTQRNGMGLGQMIYRQMTHRERPPLRDSNASLPVLQEKGTSASGQEE